MSDCSDMRSVHLKLAGAITVAANIEVLDYTSSYVDSLADGVMGNAGNGVIGVAGVFTPLTDYWHGCELHDGATIDLSGRDGEFSAVSGFARGLNTLAFTAGARVSIKLGSRPILCGERIISWTEETKPANVDSVKFKCGDGARSYGLVIKDDGLYIAKGMVISVR